KTFSCVSSLSSSAVSARMVCVLSRSGCLAWIAAFGGAAIVGAAGVVEAGLAAGAFSAAPFAPREAAAGEAAGLVAAGFVLGVVADSACSERCVVGISTPLPTWNG